MITFPYLPAKQCSVFLDSTNWNLNKGFQSVLGKQALNIQILVIKDTESHRSYIDIKWTSSKSQIKKERTSTSTSSTLNRSEGAELDKFRSAVPDVTAYLCPVKLSELSGRHDCNYCNWWITSRGEEGGPGPRTGPTTRLRSASPFPSTRRRPGWTTWTSTGQVR